MRRLLVVLIALAIAVPCSGDEPQFVYFKKKAAAVAPGGGGQSFSDNFDRADADSLGANWTEVAGDIDIASNAIILMSTSWTNMAAIYTGTECNTVNQYTLITSVQDTLPNQYPTLFLRYTDASSPVYVIELHSNVIWKYRPTPGGSDTDIESGALTISAGDEIGVTITGTGASTIVRVWLNPTGLPSAADNWNGDSTPNLTFTNDPGANAVDTGNYVGIGGAQESGDLSFDNFFGGDVP